MGYDYILGGPGTGKTELCIKRIISAQSGGGSNAVIYIVPEQFSLQSEKSLLNASPENALIRAKVLSFQRLSYYVFSELGAVKKTVLDDTGKNMLLRRVLFELKDELKFFKGAIDKPGFIDSLSATVTELYQYDISAEKMSGAIDNISGSDNLRLKIQDLLLIFKNYQAYLEKNYISSDETLDILAEKISKSSLVNGAEVWIDGFKSFTPQEYKVIEKLLICAGNVTFSLTVNELSESFSKVSDSDPFYEVKNTINTINQLAGNNSINRGKTVCLNENLRHKAAPDLKFLAENFFGLNVVPFKGVSESIKTVYADNMNDEIHYAAGKITELTMERGYRLNDIAVVSCASEEYEKNIKIVFSQYDLPVFIDENKDVLSHPLVELIRSALEIIAYNWQYESVFRLLKTHLLPVFREETDLLENYVLAYGIKGDRWKKPWVYGFGGRYEHFNEAEMNCLRQEVVSALEPLAGRFNRRGKYNVADVSKALYGFIADCGASDVLSEWITQAHKDGQVETYREHSQIWDKIVLLLDRTVDILGEERLSIAEYREILEAGFSGTKMGLAPHSMDQIIVGDLRRTRLPEVKALFLLGANEGMLPGKTGQSGLFSDDDRKIISGETDVRLAGGSFSRVCEEQLSIYSCISKPSEFLSLSCFLGGLDGKSLRPSIVLDKISELLPAAEKITPSRLPKHTLLAVLPAKPMFNGFSALLREFAQTGEIPDLYKDIYSYFIANEKYRSRLKEIEELMRSADKPEKLSKKSIDGLYPSVINSSVSKLEKYEQCPFAYFVQYNLSAKERKTYEVASIDLGNIFHKVLESFSSRLREERISMGTLDNETLSRLALESVDETFSLEENEIFNSSGQYKYFAERVKEISMMSIWALTEHMRSGQFELAFTEASFSNSDDGDANLSAIRIPLDNNSEMQLEGRIDRVDMAGLDGEGYVKIIDYKSGDKKFSFTEVFYGLQLQLLIYMDAFIKKYGEKFGRTGDITKMNPAAVFYFRLLDPVVNYNEKLLKLDESGLQELLLRQYKMSGAVLSDPKVLEALDKGSGNVYSRAALSMEGFQALMDYCMKKVREIGNDILSGNISALPYRFKDNTGCKYCRYKSICKFDSLQNSPKYRRFKNISDKDAMTEMFADCSRLK